MANPLTAVIIKGNPKYVNNPQAQAFYQHIANTLTKSGVQRIIYDPGLDYTKPPMADLYIGHSRGCSRAAYVKNPQMFLKLGDPEGIMHPKDREYHQSHPTATPIPEHFVLTPEMICAIDYLVRRARIQPTTEAYPASLQWITA